MLVDDERRAEANAGFAAAKDQQAALEGEIDDLVAHRTDRCAGFLVFDHLDADHQAAAAHFADVWECLATHVRRRCSIFSPTVAALAMPSRSRMSMVASAAAIETGLPPKVEAWEPGTQSMISARAMQMPSGMPEAMPLAMQTMSG